MTTRMPARRQRGQSMTEYVVICAALAAALFAGKPSIAQQLAAAVKAFYRALSFYISLP